MLTVSPRENGKGILNLTLRPTKATGDQPEQPRLAAPIFPSVKFDNSKHYVLYLNATGEDYGGAAVQKLPLDLGRGTSFQLVGSAELDIPFTLSATGRLEARTEDGTAVRFHWNGAGVELIGNEQGR